MIKFCALCPIVWWVCNKNKKFQVGHVDMEICTVKVMGLIQQHLAVHYSTMVWVVVHAMKLNVLMIQNGVSLVPLLSLPLISVPLVVGVTLLIIILISLNLFFNTLLNIKLVLFLLFIEGNLIFLILFYFILNNMWGKVRVLVQG